MLQKHKSHVSLRTKKLLHRLQRRCGVSLLQPHNAHNTKHFLNTLVAAGAVAAKAAAACSTCAIFAYGFCVSSARWTTNGPQGKIHKSKYHQQQQTAFGAAIDAAREAIPQEQLHELQQAPSSPSLKLP